MVILVSYIYKYNVISIKSITADHRVIILSMLDSRGKLIMLMIQHTRFIGWTGHKSNLFSDAVENFVHFHTRWVPVVSKPDHKNSVLLRQDGLVDLPAVMEMW